MAGSHPTESAGGRGGERETRSKARAGQVRDTLLVLLTFGAGCVDAISYLGLGQIFTANMTGNTVLLGVAAAHGEAVRALRSGVAFAGFAMGVLVASTVAGPRPADSGDGVWPRRVTLALTFELVVLAAFLAGWEVTGADPSGIARYVLIGLSAMAMGAQSGAVRRLSVSGVATTYVTGTLAGLVELVAVGRKTTGWARRIGVLVALFAGAAVGGALVIHVSWAAPIVSLAAAAVVVAVAAPFFRGRLVGG